MWPTSTDAPAESRQILRFAFAVCLAATLAAFQAGPAPAILPLLVGILVKPGAKPIPAKLAVLVLIAGYAFFALGRFVTHALLVLPAVEFLFTALVLYFFYYMNLRGAPPILPTLGIMATLVTPVMGSLSLHIASALPLAMFSLLALALTSSWIAFVLWPVTTEELAPSSGPETRDYSPAQAHALARNSALAALPILFLCIHRSDTAYLTALIYIGLTFLEKSSSAAARKQGVWILANLLAAGVGLFLVGLSTAAQSHAIVALSFLLTALLFGRQMATRVAHRAVWSTAFSATLLIWSSGDAGDKASSRVLQVLFVILYTGFVRQFIIPQSLKLPPEPNASRLA